MKPLIEFGPILSFLALLAYAAFREPLPALEPDLEVKKISDQTIQKVIEFDPGLSTAMTTVRIWSEQYGTFRKLPHGTWIQLCRTPENLQISGNKIMP